MTSVRSSAAKSKRQRGVARNLQLPLTGAEQALQDQVRVYLGRQAPGEAARTAIETAERVTQDRWRDLSDMEWLGILVPEASGGAGGTMLEAALLAEEMGRWLLPGPFIPTALMSAPVLAEFAPEQLPDLLAGAVRATVSLAAGITFDTGVSCATGSASDVLEADVADLIVVAATAATGEALLLVERASAGVSLVPEPSLDETRTSSTLVLDRAECSTLVTGTRAREVATEVGTNAAIACGADLVGGAAQCLEMTVEYAKQRVQFGRPIGSYQAVKHALVDVLVSVEAARAAVRHAARLSDLGHEDRHLFARTARVAAVSAARRAATAAIQFHGGSGFTWDNDAHLYLKRAKASERIPEPLWRHRELIARDVAF